MHIPLIENAKHYTHKVSCTSKLGCNDLHAEVEKYVIFSVPQQKWNNGYLKGQFQLQCKNRSGWLLWSQRWTAGICFLKSKVFDPRNINLNLGEVIFAAVWSIACFSLILSKNGAYLLIVVTLRCWELDPGQGWRLLLGDFIGVSQEFSVPRGRLWAWLCPGPNSPELPISS